LVLISSLSYPVALRAQERPDTNRVTVSGRVVDSQTRKAIPRALIEIADVELSILTDQEGRFVLPDLRRGEYGMVVSKAGYVASEGDFRVERAGSLELLLTPLSLPDPTRPSKVLGWVTDRATGTPLEGATVAIPSLEVRRFTDRRGWFDLGDVPVGAYLLEVGTLGYETLVDSIRVQGGRTLEVRIPLATEPIELEGITVRAHSRFLETAGFFRRTGRGYNGRQWTAEEIAVEDPMFVEDLATQVLGVRRGQTRGGTKALIGRRGCQLDVFIDDVHIEGFDLDHLDPLKIQALEVYHGYASEMPVEYGPLLGHCGVVLVWLKH